MCLALLGLAGLAGAGGGALGSLATLAGTALSAAGAASEGNAAAAVADYNAQVARNNAQAEQQRAAYEAGMTRDRVRGVIAQQRAGYASSGLDPRTGTPVTVLGDSAKQGELDVLSRLYAGESAATAYRNDAARLAAEGAAQKSASRLNAATTLIGGLSKIAGRRYEPLRTT
ncbi:MAG: hypothetical protein H6883_08170 [Rhodobiaceae bacterium]|nr:hypothetical protein [Rhodobiaceae bacterium]MCC0056098.1 hypothetical protein [Rhodobiaceae bacterium]